MPALAHYCQTNRFLRECIWHDWRAASRQERLLRVLALASSLSFMAVIVFGGPSLQTLGVKQWFLIPPIMLILIGGQLALIAAVAFSTARR